MITKELERLAQRGPHGDAHEVIDHALHARAVPQPTSARPPRIVVAVCTGALLAGALVVLAQRLRDDGPAATVPAGSSSVPADVSVGPPGPSMLCATVEFTWASSTGDIVVTQRSGRSFTAGREMFEVATDVYLERGTIDDHAPVVDTTGVRVVDVKIAGFQTQVFPNAMGAAGPHASFVFPPDAPPDDPCNVWTISASRPMDIEPFAQLAGALRMRHVTTGEYAWVSRSELALTDDTTLIVEDNCVTIESPRAKGSMCGTPLSTGVNVVGAADDRWAFGLGPPGTTHVTAGDVTETRLLDLGGYRAFALPVGPTATTVTAIGDDGATIATYAVRTGGNEPAAGP